MVSLGGVPVQGSGEFGPGPGSIFLSHVNCSGDELNLSDCPASEGNLTVCIDVGVQCPLQSIDIGIWSTEEA